MPTPIEALIGKPFVGRRAGLDAAPPIIKAVDITDVCPSRFGGRNVIAYARIEGAIHAAFIVCSMTDPLDGVCTTVRAEHLSGGRGVEIARRDVISFARSIGVQPGMLVELALMHMP